MHVLPTVRAYYVPYILYTFIFIFYSLPLVVARQLVDVSYGGDNGFSQAIELSQEALANVKFVQEKKLIASFFDEISQDTGKFCFGVGDTLKALELGAVKKLIVFENLEVMRYEIKNNSTGETKVLHLNPDQQV
jgi:peptide chain release factor subunit 1